MIGQTQADWRKSNLGHAGFTLIEMMISLAIVSIIIATVTALFIRSGRLYTTQNATAALQQDVRAAMDVMVSEMRSAGYDPTKSKDFSIKRADRTSFRFRADLNGDGKLGQTGNPFNADGECEDRSFRYSLSSRAIQMMCGSGSAPGSTETLLGGTDSDIKVTALDFSYRDRKNTETTIVSEIRGAVLTITAQAPAGQAGMITRTYRTMVNFRNAGPNT